LKAKKQTLLNKFNKNYQGESPKSELNKTKER